MTDYINIDNKLKNPLINIFNKNDESEEYLLNPENNRLTMYPIKNKSLWDMYNIQVAAFWTPNEIDLSKDYDHFINKLNKDEQYFVKMVLAFFAASDTIVNINLTERFIKEIKIREGITCYNYQVMMEDIHSQMYSLLIETLIKDQDEKDKLFNAITNYPCIGEKAAWALKWIESNASFAHRLIAFAIVEGVFFSGSFCSIFWLKKRNIMPGLCASNELISRDEGLHTDFAVLLYSMFENKLPESEVHDIFIEAVNIETKFICESLPCALLGMNSDLMTTYIKFVADRLIKSLGYNKIWNLNNPFDFMESISIEGKANFFELRPTEYQKASVLNNTRETIFEFTNDF
jgi:ribonucleotide reductase beta subunit family protein with ferritin-like domain